MGFCPAGMAMDLQECATFFPGQSSGVFFQLAADAFAAGCFINGEITDAGKIAFQGDLGDEVQGEKSEDMGSGGCAGGRGWGGGKRSFRGGCGGRREWGFPDEQHFCGIVQELGYAPFQKSVGTWVFQLVQ